MPKEKEHVKTWHPRSSSLTSKHVNVENGIPKKSKQAREEKGNEYYRELILETWAKIQNIFSHRNFAINDI